ncbi:MAG: hypothetical protein JXA33_16730 [Anaerolineae bacterium]|nr:hypothetical protein [Anaerolineae bacterium]
MKLCTRCVLPETFPGIEFDEEGVCQYCRHMPSPEHRAEQKARLRARFEQLVAEVRDEPGYHGLMSWSGGKDSTYTLWLLRHEYNLRVLAFTFDNAFISPAAIDNMRTVADNLGIDHVIIRPNFPFMRRAFAASVIDPEMYSPKALERASSICNTCMGLAKGIALRLALEKDIPMMVYGWSPGQIPLPSAVLYPKRRMLQAMVEAATAPFVHIHEQVAAYFPESRQFEAAPRMPANVSPLVFLDWHEDEAVEVIQAHGWVRPDDTDPNSTNCLLNVFANHMHEKQMGYHAYAMELAGLVREGYMSREEALRRLTPPPSLELASIVAERLGIPISSLAENSGRS